MKEGKQKMKRNNIENMKQRSAWMKGVREYALEMLEGIGDDVTEKSLEKALLNGAYDWKEYSYGGCALIYNSDIARRPNCAKYASACVRRIRKKIGWMFRRERSIRHIR